MTKTQPVSARSMGLVVAKGFQSARIVDFEVGESFVERAFAWGSAGDEGKVLPSVGVAAKSEVDGADGR